MAFRQNEGTNRRKEIREKEEGMEVGEKSKKSERELRQFEV